MRAFRTTLLALAFAAPLPAFPQAPSTRELEVARLIQETIRKWDMAGL